MRRRSVRWLPLATAVAVAALATGIGFAASGDDDRPVAEPAAPEPELWTGTATLLKTARSGLIRCGGAITTSLPPAGCGGAAVRGLDPMTVPGATRYPNGTIVTPSVRLVGTWDGHALTVTQDPVLAKAAPSPDTPIPGPSCPEPAGGWGHDQIDPSAMERLNAYVESQPDAGTMRVDASQRVMTVPFTGDLDRHRSEIAKVYDGPFCVEHVAHSSKELADVSSRAMHDLQARGFQLLTGGGQGVQPYVEWSVVAATREQMRQIEGEYDGMLRLSSFLVPTS